MWSNSRSRRHRTVGLVTIVAALFLSACGDQTAAGQAGLATVGDETGETKRSVETYCENYNDLIQSYAQVSSAPQAGADGVYTEDDLASAIAAVETLAASAPDPEVERVLLAQAEQLRAIVGVSAAEVEQDLAESPIADDTPNQFAVSFCRTDTIIGGSNDAPLVRDGKAFETSCRIEETVEGASRTVVVALKNTAAETRDFNADVRYTNSDGSAFDPGAGGVFEALAVAPGESLLYHTGMAPPDSAHGCTFDWFDTSPSPHLPPEPGDRCTLEELNEWNTDIGTVDYAHSDASPGEPVIAFYDADGVRLAAGMVPFEIPVQSPQAGTDAAWSQQPHNASITSCAVIARTVG